MADQMNEESVRTILETGMAQAKGMLSNPAQVDDILAQAKTRLADVPGIVGGALADVPMMVTMIKCYITGEYSAVSPKVVASVLGALIYLVKGKDIIPDSIPILGLADDLAVLTLAIKINGPEIKAFEEWQKGHVILRDQQ